MRCNRRWPAPLTPRSNSAAIPVSPAQPRGGGRAERRRWCIAALLFCNACRAADSTAEAAAQNSRSASLSLSASRSEPAAPALPPLQAQSWLEPLPLPNENLAYVTPPLGAREPRPLIVAVHGAGDRPEWACGGWRLAASEFAFVVCPRGLAMDAQRFAWDSARTIAQRVQEALAAVRARYGAYLAPGAVAYAGFSQGATLAEAALLAEQDRFPLLILAEGGYNLMRDARFLSRIRERGTRRVLLVCGSARCFATAKAVRDRFERAGLQVMTAGDPLSGHNLNQRMQAALHRSFPSFVRGAAGWTAFDTFLQQRAR